MANYVLDKSYRITNASGVAAARAVVRTTSEGECALPSAANAGQVLGITTHAQTRQHRFVAVRRLGIAVATAASAIELGAPVCVADEHGRVKQALAPAYVFGSVGSNNAVRIEWTDRPSFGAATQIELVNDGADQTFEWSITPGKIEILVTTNGGGSITMTAAQLITAINGDAALSKFLHAANEGASNGSGTVSAAAESPEDIGDGANVIGIAEQAATQEGDLLEVFLTL